MRWQQSSAVNRNLPYVFDNWNNCFKYSQEKLLASKPSQIGCHHAHNVHAISIMHTQKFVQSNDSSV